MRIENSGLHVEGLGRNLQALGNFLQNVSARLFQAPFNLREVHARDARELAQLAQGDLRGRALLAQEGAKVERSLFAHDVIVGCAATSAR